jgi:uncharacterized membrane protein
MSRYIAAYVGTGAVLLFLDILWLRFAGEAVFRPEVGPILAENPNLTAAGLFYLFFSVGLFYFAVVPALRDSSFLLALANGAALGFIAYMTFDLTTLAVVKGWSVKVAVIDIAWGTLVSAVSAGAGYGLGAVVSRG